MQASLPAVELFSLADRFSETLFARQGQDHWPVYETWADSSPDGSLLGIDLRGAEYVGLSYAKRTILRLVIQRMDGSLGERKLFIVAPAGEDEFLEGLRDALKEHGLFMLVAATEQPLSDPYLIGDVPAAIEETFDVLKRSAPVTTGSLARLLRQTPQATKNRLDRFDTMGLLKREKIPSPTGGLEWENRIF
jgi:hypothetical protein